MRARIGSWLAAGGLAGWIAVAPVAADVPSEAVVRLLEVGWGITPQARAAADEQLPEVLRSAADDPRHGQAVWLVLMQQRRFDEALRRLDEHLVRWPDELIALRAKTWIVTVLKNYPAAFVTADRLSKALAVARPTTDAERAAFDDAIGFLGRLAGYLGGPVADAVNQDERKAAERKWLSRLAESQRPRFEEARDGVLSRYIEMTDESALAHERALAAAKTEQERTLADLQAEREAIAARTKELEERRNKVNSEFRAELEAIAKQDQPLVQQSVGLTAQVNNLDADLLNYEGQIATLTQLAARERNPTLAQQYLAQANALAITAARIQAELIAARSLLQRVQNQRAALAARRGQAQANAAAQTERLDRELAELSRRERRSDNLEKRAARPVAPSTSKIRSLAAQAAAFSTYDAFPLEAAKAGLLEALR